VIVGVNTIAPITHDYASMFFGVRASSDCCSPHDSDPVRVELV